MSSSLLGDLLGSSGLLGGLLGDLLGGSLLGSFLYSFYSFINANLLSHGLTPKVQNAAVYPANGGRLRNKIRINILEKGLFMPR